jgi:hypothetical protein
MSAAPADIDQLIKRLDEAAERLRSEELSVEDAAALVDECAGLAVEASAALERRARGEQPPAEGQEALTGPRQDPLL